MSAGRTAGNGGKGVRGGIKLRTRAELNALQAQVFGLHHQKMKQKDIAARLGITQNYVSYILRYHAPRQVKPVTKAVDDLRAEALRRLPPDPMNRTEMAIEIEIGRILVDREKAKIAAKQHARNVKIWRKNDVYVSEGPVKIRGESHANTGGNRGGGRARHEAAQRKFREHCSRILHWLMEHDEGTTDDFERELGIGKTTLCLLLRDLRDRGHVTRRNAPHRGNVVKLMIYRITEAGREAVQATLEQEAREASEDLN